MSNKAIRIVVLAVLLSLAICGFLVQTTESAVADQLWNKYRVKLIQLLQGRFKRYSKGVKAFGGHTNLAQTALHIVTDPVDAMWAKDIKKLHDFAGYVPQWTTNYSSRQVKDNEQCARYKQLLFSHTNKKTAATEFVNFSKSPQVMEESPYHEKLARFIARTKNAKPNAFRFVVEEKKGSITIGTPWGKKTSSFSRMSSMVRSLEKSSGNKALWDDVLLGDEHESGEGDEEEGDEEEEIPDDENLSSSEFLFRRRRRRRAPPKPKPIVIKSKKFHMDMKARGLIGIPIRAKCVNRNFIHKNRRHFKGKWFGKNGKFSLLPSVVWLAMRPNVVLRLSESEFKTVQSKWKHKNSLGMAIAGTLFRNRNFRRTVLSDEIDHSLSGLFSEETLRDMRENDDLMDSASFVVKSTNDEGEEVVMQEGALEDYMEEVEMIPEDDTLLSMADDDGMLQEIPDDENLPSSEFLFRRRRRRRKPKKKPKPPTIKEKVYEARFQSNSQYPQILAVTSDIV